MNNCSKLIDIAKSNSFRPTFDKSSEIHPSFLKKMEQCGFGSTLRSPGNDLYSHAVEITRGNYAFTVFIRFDLQIFAVVSYEVNGTARYWIPYRKDLEAMLLPMIEFLRSEGFCEVDNSTCNTDLGEATLEQGMLGSTLFAYYFEDG